MSNSPENNNKNKDSLFSIAAALLIGAASSGCLIATSMIAVELGADIARYIPAVFSIFSSVPFGYKIATENKFTINDKVSFSLGIATYLSLSLMYTYYS